MSAPNKNYDPKATASLAPDEVARVLDEALTAVAAAGTLDELKAARIAHEGDRAPLSLASSEIGALPPEARADAGRRVGAARQQQPKGGRQIVQQQLKRGVHLLRADQVVVIQHQHNLAGQPVQLTGQDGHHRLERGGLRVLERRSDPPGGLRVRTL